MRLRNVVVALLVLSATLSARADSYLYTLTVSSEGAFDGTSTWTEPSILTSETTISTGITTTVVNLKDITIDPTAGNCPISDLSGSFSSCIEEDLTTNDSKFGHYFSVELNAVGTYGDGVFESFSITDVPTTTPEPS